MGYVIPVVVVVLALVAAGSIVYLAWELTSKDVQDQIERSLGRPRDPEGNDPADRDANPSSRPPPRGGAE